MFDRVVVCGGVMSRAPSSHAWRPRQHLSRQRLFDHGHAPESRAIAHARLGSSCSTKSPRSSSSRFGPNRLRVAGTAEFNGYNRDIRAERIDPLINWCRAHFPGMSTAQSVPWTGLRPMMPNMLPRVGARPQSARVLQHRPRPSRLDAVGGDRRRGRRARRSAAQCDVRRFSIRKRRPQLPPP